MTKIKICGLTRAVDVTAVNAVLPDYAGFVFAEGSRRKISVETAVALREKLDPRVISVGVFVNQEPEFIAELLRKKIIGMVQLHGDECAKYITKLREMCGCEIIKAVGVGEEPPAVNVSGEVAKQSKIADFLLFDTLSPARGGTGKPFDHRLLQNYTGLPYFLAGGLTPENVADAVHLLSPFCVDVSSGVETDGAKDAKKILEFTQAVRNQKNIKGVSSND